MSDMSSRNPFRMRATEYVEGDWNFISLFGQGAIDVMDADSMLTNIQIIRSSRGGGKTSILRLFAPRSLNEIHIHRDNSEISSLYKRLKKLDVLSENGPQILGVYLSLFGNYSILEQLVNDERKQWRLFSSLLACRVVMATLRSICELKKLTFPKSLRYITIKDPAEPNVPNFVDFPCTGTELYDWAQKTERKISNIIDEESDDYGGLSMHENLTLLHVIRAENIFCNGEPAAQKTLLMLDDLDKLSSSQRVKLSNTLTCLRPPIGLWMAERLEGLQREELLSTEGTAGREYNKPVVLERFWRDNPDKFKRLLSDIADRRAQQQRTYNITFSTNLHDDLGNNWDEKFNDATRKEYEQITSKFGRVPKYKKWIKSLTLGSDLPSKEAEDWRALGVAIARDNRRSQQRLFEDEPLEPVDLYHVMNTVRKTIRHCIRIEYGIPNWFGFDDLAAVSSSNIEQFLELSSQLFDEMIAASYAHLNTRIEPEKQNTILMGAARDRWGDIENMMPHSQYIMPFLTNVAQFCLGVTNSPTVSYNSVTGIAMSKEDLRHIQSDDFRNSDEKYRRLYDVLTTCIARNLLEVDRIRQGPKGTVHLVMYLNRLLCLQFGLPTAYGGWQERDLDTLCSFLGDPKQDVVWMDMGTREKNRV